MDAVVLVRLVGSRRSVRRTPHDERCSVVTVTNASRIAAYLQKELNRLALDEVTAVEAASWLDTAGLLTDSPSRPGLPLRELLRAGEIASAEQRPPRPNGRWYILRANRRRPRGKIAGERRPNPAPTSRTVESPSSEPDGFTRTALASVGFQGFLKFKGIDLKHVPDEPGVYVVLREEATRPQFLDTNPAGWFKGRDPTVPIEELEAAWPEGAHCIYIGKAERLRRRIRQFRQYGDGQPVGHQGGRRIWQLSDADQFIVAWLTTQGRNPEIIEGELLRAFVAKHGTRPMGNRTSGRRMPTV